MALWVTIYLSLMEPEGLRKVNDLSSAGAHYLHEELLKTGRFQEVFPDRPFLKEFVLKPIGESAQALQERLLKKGFLAALPTEEGYVSFCVTEKRSRQETDALIQAVKEG